MDSNPLDIIEPEGRPVNYRREQLQIVPLTIGQIPRMVRTARPVVDAVLALDAVPDGDGLVDLALSLVGDHGEALQQAAAIAVNRELAWIAGGNSAEFLDLAVAVFEVNRDFFVQTLGPRLRGLREKAGLRPGAGQTLSSSLPSADIH
jgi:hypothetical protein